jgi:hypothetical protein
MRSTECTSTTIIIHSTPSCNRRCRHHRLSRPFLLCRVIDNLSALILDWLIFFVFVHDIICSSCGWRVGESWRWGTGGNFRRQILTHHTHTSSFLLSSIVSSSSYTHSQLHSHPFSHTSSFFQHFHFNSTLNQPEQHPVLSNHFIIPHPLSVQEYPIHLELS